MNNESQKQSRKILEYVLTHNASNQKVMIFTEPNFSAEKELLISKTVGIGLGDGGEALLNCLERATDSPKYERTTPLDFNSLTYNLQHHEVI